jgi:hypothetical protein
VHHITLRIIGHFTIHPICAPVISSLIVMMMTGHEIIKALAFPKDDDAVITIKSGYKKRFDLH